MVIITEDPLRNYDPAKVTFGQVKGEVSQAMRHDWKRDKVDDAKKRAITSCRNYDEFKARVAGCTLKPIHRSEFNAPPKFAYNRHASGELGAKAPGSGSSTNAGEVAGSSTARPAAAAARGACTLRSGRDFERELRRCSTAEDRVALLAQLDGPTCGRFFGRELDAEVLRQLLVALEEATGGDVGAVARRFLASLAAYCPSSTATAASFLTPGERGLVANLLSRHADEVSSPAEDVRICAAFGVPPVTRWAASVAAEPAAAAAEPAGPTAQPTSSVGGDYTAEEGASEGVAAAAGPKSGNEAEQQDEGPTAASAAETPAGPDYESMD